MDQQASISKAPLPITIIGLLLVIVGILGVLGTIMMESFLLMATAGYASDFLMGFLLTAIPGLFFLVVIFAGIGLRKMKKWSLYLLILVTVFSMVEPIRNIVVGAWSNEIFIMFIITVGITLYCWKKRTLFS